jgi:hypothetical protein
MQWRSSWAKSRGADRSCPYAPLNNLIFHRTCHVTMKGDCSFLIHREVTGRARENYVGLQSSREPTDTDGLIAPTRVAGQSARAQRSAWMIHRFL